jgi:signal transduction histidine kinase
VSFEPDNTVSGITVAWITMSVAKPTPLLGRCRFLTIVFGVAALLGGSAVGLSDPVRAANAVYALSPAQLAAGLPVELEGIVTFSDPNYRGLFVHDSTAGIFIKPPYRFPALDCGSRVVIKGRIDPGEFAPIVIATEIKVFERLPFPRPKTVTFEQLATGLQTSQWIEVTGVIRAAHTAPRSGLYLDPSTGPGREFGSPILRTSSPEPGMFIDIALSGGRLSGFVSKPRSADPAALIGATVRIRGVCSSRFNENGQFRAPTLRIPSLDEIDIVQPPSSEIIEVNVVDLLRYSSPASLGTRVKLQGVVTASPAADLLFVVQGGIGLQVRTLAGNVAIRRGDLIEVIGFPALGQFRPTIEDAIYRPTGRRASAEAVKITPLEALRGAFSASQHDASLVQIKAQLLHRVRIGREQQLVLQADGIIFNAYLPERTESDRLFDLRDGSLLEVTGVCLVQKSDNWNTAATTDAKAFQLHLDSPADVAVLRLPAWWTLTRLVWAVGILTFAILLALAWVTILRRRVHDQTEFIKAEVQGKAITGERTRIAREFHDTVEQELAAISMQLDAVDASLLHSPSTARAQLVIARNMSRRSFSEVRRSVWDLRSQLLEQHNLPDALRETLKPISGRASAHIAVEVEGNVRRLPIRIETHLLRIGQEAVTNALKHAKAGSIQLTCHYREGEIQLRIRDDGCGFDTGIEISVSGGHFGLLDMRERAEKIGSLLMLKSRPCEGTEIVVTVKDDPSHRHSTHEAYP